ncbi:MAG: FkbM family methyltransferase [Candidatus Hydrogenedentota bacterium]
MSLVNIQIPVWLENSRIFRTLFVIRKSYYARTRRARRTHYAQFGEDISIARFFDYGYSGFFVDVGCFHPKKYSNTWQLYQRGWRGINIDIDTIKIQAFDLVRPQDTNIACAISNTEGEFTYYTDGFYSPTVSLDEEFAKENKYSKNEYRQKKTLCKKLTATIDDTMYKDRPIDVLSVDAEARDLDVLESLDFTRYDPKIVAVETHIALFKDVEKSQLYKFLESKGYDLVGWCGFTLLMASSSHQRALKG